MPAAARIAPGRRSRHDGDASVRRRNAPRNRATPSANERPKASTLPSSGTSGAPRTTELLTVRAATATPNSASIPRARSRATTMFARRRRGTFHTPFSAVCIAIMAPIPAQRAPRRPMAKARPLPGRPPTLSRSWSPITGNWARAEPTSRSSSSGFDASAQPRTVVRTRSNGKIEKNE